MVNAVGASTIQSQVHLSLIHNDQMPQDERGPEISFKIHIPPSKGLLNDED